MYKISYRSHVVENSKCAISDYFIFIHGFHCVTKESELGLCMLSLQLSAFIPCEAFSQGASPCFHRILFPTMLLSWIMMLNNKVPDTQTCEMSFGT